MTSSSPGRDGHKADEWALGITIVPMRNGNIKMTFLPGKGKDEIWRRVRVDDCEDGPAEEVGDEWIIWKGQIYLPLAQVL